MKSILQKKDGTCYLCRILHGDDGQKTVQEHHVIFGTAGRKMAEKYGLKVYLCLAHHTDGPEAVHVNAKMALMLKVQAQRSFEKEYPELNWMEIFGKNYDIEPEESGEEAGTSGKTPASGKASGQQESETRSGTPGFWFLETGSERPF